MKKHHFIVIALVIIAAMAWLLAPRITHPKSELPVQKRAVSAVKIGDTVFRVGVVDTPEAREQGLSYRDSLPDDQGLLFVFETPKKYPFWMKDMRFPIDIVWIGEDMRVVYAKVGAMPESYPEIFTPDRDARYVLEVNAGVVAEKKIKIGDEVFFTR